MKVMIEAGLPLFIRVTLSCRDTSICDPWEVRVPGCGMNLIIIITKCYPPPLTRNYGNLFSLC